LLLIPGIALSTSGDAPGPVLLGLSFFLVGWGLLAVLLRATVLAIIGGLKTVDE
jgi:hypothetical protein